MLTIAHAPADAVLAERLQRDLAAQGMTLSPSVQPGREHLLLALVSPAANVDAAVQASIAQALDNGQHVILLQTGEAAPPKLIDHLQPLDFREARYPLTELLQAVRAASAPGASLPLKVLTPRTRRRNQNIGFWLALIALFWFLVGIIGVGFLGIQAPREEYNTINTEVAATIIVAIDANLPRSTEEAANFPATVQAAPTAQRPLLIATATARAEDNQ